MDHQTLSESVQSLAGHTPSQLRALWPRWFDGPPPARLRQNLLIRALAYQMQERQQGGLRAATRDQLRVLAEARKTNAVREVIDAPRLTPGTHLIREWGNEMHQVMVEASGFVYRGTRYRSLSEIARRITGTRWSGPVFFGVNPASRKPKSEGEGSV